MWGIHDYKLCIAMRPNALLDIISSDGNYGVCAYFAFCPESAFG